MALPLDARASFSFRGLRPPDPPTRGSAPQTPVIGSLPLAMTPAFRFLFLYDWSPAECAQCDNKDPNLNKSGKLYKVCFIIEHMLQKFQHYYSPQQMLSIDEGMVPIIQAILERQAHKMGRQDFILTDSRNDYLYDAEVYDAEVLPVRC